MAETIEELNALPEVTSSLRNVLLDLHATPYPEVPNPTGAPKRASVALIIRVQPSYSHWPSTQASTFVSAAETAEDRIRDFFEQDWVKHGDPEVLFIKRATRQGDRWTGHTALPGGRRDPEDQDDQAAAIRESLEEVGVDLAEDNAIAVGNLPQRVVTTSWGRVPLMVLCPFVFLITRHDLPPLRLQPTEVGSTHWVSLRALLSSKQRTYEYQDVSSRMARQEFGFRRYFLRSMIGRMRFAAVHLIPSESQYCSEIPGFVPEDERKQVSEAGVDVIRKLFATDRATQKPSHPSQNPLLLWGLTLGVVADFLELLPPHTALELWTYPTFTPWDVRFVLWLMSYNFRQQKRKELYTEGLGPSQIGQVQDSEGVPVEPPKYPEVGIGGLGAGTYYSEIRKAQISRNSGIGILLEGYYEIIQKAVVVALAGRVSTAALLGAAVWWHRRRLR